VCERERERERESERERERQTYKKGERKRQTQKGRERERVREREPRQPPRHLSLTKSRMWRVQIQPVFPSNSTTPEREKAGATIPGVTV